MHSKPTVVRLAALLAALACSNALANVTLYENALTSGADWTMRATGVSNVVTASSAVFGGSGATLTLADTNPNTNNQRVAIVNNTATNFSWTGHTAPVTYSMDVPELTAGLDVNLLLLGYASDETRTAAGSLATPIDFQFKNVFFFRVLEIGGVPRVELRSKTNASGLGIFSGSSVAIGSQNFNSLANSVGTWSFTIDPVANTVLATAPDSISTSAFSLPGGIGSFFHDAQLILQTQNTLASFDGAALTLANLGFTSAIPEPSAFAAVAGLAILGFAATRRRRLSAATA